MFYIFGLSSINFNLNIRFVYKRFDLLTGIVVSLRLHLFKNKILYFEVKLLIDLMLLTVCRVKLTLVVMI